MGVLERLLAGLTMLSLALSTVAQYQGRPTGILAPDRSAQGAYCTLADKKAHS